MGLCVCQGVCIPGVAPHHLHICMSIPELALTISTYEWVFQASPHHLHIRMSIPWVAPHHLHKCMSIPGLAPPHSALRWDSGARCPPRGSCCTHSCPPHSSALWEHMGEYLHMSNCECDTWLVISVLSNTCIAFVSKILFSECRCTSYINYWIIWASHLSSVTFTHGKAVWALHWLCKGLTHASYASYVLHAVYDPYTGLQSENAIHLCRHQFANMYVCVTDI